MVSTFSKNNIQYTFELGLILSCGVQAGIIHARVHPRGRGQSSLHPRVPGADKDQGEQAVHAESDG